MSMHKSLVSKGHLKRQRSVLTRAERIDKLRADEVWEEGASVFGLPKVKVVKISRKKEKPTEVETEETPAEALAEDGVPAADEK